MEFTDVGMDLTTKGNHWAAILDARRRGRCRTQLRVRADYPIDVVATITVLSSG